VEGVGAAVSTFSLDTSGFASHPTEQGNIMPQTRNLISVTLIALLAVPGCGAYPGGNLQTTLGKLNQAAKNFRSTSADFEFDTNQTLPVPDTDILKGVAYYKRDGTNFKMAAHIATDNGAPTPKTYTFADGVFRLYEPMIPQVTTFSRASKFAEYVMLGFGASGDELAAKWDITDLGPETIGGVETEKLELLAKDPTVRKNLPKVTIWMDLNRAVSLKQIFDEGQGTTRVCTYTNIKTTQKLLPDSDFTFKPKAGTQFINR
jgi:outer membrane lipoprotein-sorting protein